MPQHNSDGTFGVLVPNWERALDAFGRLRVSDPYSQFESKLTVDAAPLWWSETTAGAAGTTSVYQTGDSCQLLSVLNLTAHSRTRRTFQRMPYQSGKAGRLFLTGVLGAPITGITTRCGLFDATDGLFFRMTAAGLAVVIRRGGSDANAVLQSAFNGDKLNGTGLSRITLDPTKAPVWWIDYEWLGTGSVRFGIMNGNIPVTCHTVSNLNALTSPYISVPTLPAAWEIANDGTGPAASLTCICAGHMSEGGREGGALTFPADNGVTAKNAAGQALVPLLSIRLRSGLYRNGICIPVKFGIVCDTTSTFRWFLMLNPTTLTGATFAVPISGSCIESDVAATVVGGGTVIDSGYSQQASEGQFQSQVATTRWLGESAAGAADILSLGVQRVSAAGNDNFYGSLTWSESV